jgi:hypothetical protein
MDRFMLPSGCFLRRRAATAVPLSRLQGLIQPPFENYDRRVGVTSL